MVTNAVSYMKVLKIKLIITNKKITEIKDLVEEEEVVIMTVETTDLTMIELDFVVTVVITEKEELAFNLKKKVFAHMEQDADSRMVKMITDKKDQEEFALNSKKVNVPMVLCADLLM